MNRSIILFGAFLSAFILILVPSINCVNANIQNKNNLNIKNINIENIRKIKNRIVNSDCNCQKSINENGWSKDLLCMSLLIMVIAILSPLLLFELFGSRDMELLFNLLIVLSGPIVIAATPPAILAMFLGCEWTTWTDF